MPFLLASVVFDLFITRLLWITTVVRAAAAQLTCWLHLESGKQCAACRGVSTRRRTQPKTICVNRLTIAVDDEISSNFELDSCFTVLKDSPATSHRVFQPWTIHHDRSAANVTRRIIRLWRK